MPQRSHLYVVSGLSEVLRPFWSARLSAVAFISFSSPVFGCCFRVLLHVARSAAVSSQVALLMSSAFISLFTTSL